MNKLADVLRFKFKDSAWEELSFEGMNEFIKIKDIEGDTKRIREYSNSTEETKINFETLLRFYKEGKIKVLEGNLHELE